MAIFPTDQWVAALKEKLNTDDHYAQVARNWEGDMIYLVEPGGQLSEPVIFYLDLWHGKCRDGYPIASSDDAKASFTLKASYENYVRLLKGELDPIQAMMTRKIIVQGNMAMIMRNIPTVLDFVRCCREVTDGYL